MKIKENELECMRFFPKRKDLLPSSLFDYFEVMLCRKAWITKKQFEYNLREDYHTHDVKNNEYIKNIGKDFLVNDYDRYMEFDVWFVDDIGYYIYVNKDNCGENRLQFMGRHYYGNIMISDMQTEELLNPANYIEIKEQLSVYMNLYRRFEIFWNSVECFLHSVLEENDFRGYFLHDSKSDMYNAVNKGGLLYIYGKETVDSEEFSELSEKRNVLIPFENFVPVLNGIIEDIKNIGIEA